jgi:polyphosphate glucokinase
MDNTHQNNDKIENILAEEKILSIDIGATFIKVTVLNHKGELLEPYQRIKTPRPATPDRVLGAIRTLLTFIKDYDKVSVGFPGYIKKGVVKTAPNLGTGLWKNITLDKIISDALNKPVRIENDADMQGLAVVSKKGLEMVLTLGTGLGTALLLDGNLLPHLELAHHPVSKNRTYDDYIGDRALKKAGVKKWNRRMKKVLRILQIVFNYDRLYIGGGNASKLNLKLDNNISIINNRDGIKGGARLWQHQDNAFTRSTIRELPQIHSL